MFEALSLGLDRLVANDGRLNVCVAPLVRARDLEAERQISHRPYDAARAWDSHGFLGHNPMDGQLTNHHSLPLAHCFARLSLARWLRYRLRQRQSWR